MRLTHKFYGRGYYRPFRAFLLRHAALRHIHLFASRAKAFKDDDVLQENVTSYATFLHWALDHPAPILTGFAIFVIGSLWLAPLVGRDFFPTVDSGQMRLHARAPSGTRLEQTEVYFAA